MRTGTRDATRGGARTGGGSPARRLVLRALVTVGAVAGTAGALLPLLGRGGENRESGRNRAATKRSLERFAETYQGRHIQGSATVMVPAGEEGRHRNGEDADRVRSGPPAGGARPVPSVEVRIDGRPLHVMRRADGTYLSLVNHYESFPTLRDVARAAVDELGDAQLSLTPMTAMHSA
ncbi:tyrosinase family oxidase copper chaperone [Streptomyces pristinaespiralis]|uniref:Tyrosinase n=1 Tax=Streptomyces pristinaespiralis TaxID=38300 RepID=A0A0M3QIF0_STRPR|nr:tyrosinase family oxidase copper chaperone [Streptomyces pristinaespiralis]ALC21183.1 tyrosinase [Streptomyces pristinaespiralis]QMU16064.1 tyrosinase [Streptomyces pristinaespiralis]